MKTERQAADTILEKGVRVQLPAPFFLRLFKKEIILVLRQPRFGTMLHVASVSLKAGFEIEKLQTGELNAAHESVSQYARPLARIAAYLFLNGKWKIKFFSKLLANWLLWKLTPRRMAEIAILAVAYGGIQDFTTTIRLIGAMTMNVTAPKNLSHNKSGS